MEKKYYCECCNYNAKIKGNYNKHLKSQKHLLKSTQSQQKVNNESTQSQQKVNNLYNLGKLLFICKYCDKDFTTKQAMYRHIKYTCKKNNDEDIKELVRLLNEQTKNKDKELCEMKKQNENMQKQIDKLSNKLQIQNINTLSNSNNTYNSKNSHNNTVNYNIQLLNYDKTDYSHLTEKDYFKCIIDCNHCVKTLIEKVHFNDKKPENKNIYISNIKNKYIMLYKNNKWQLVNRKEQIDDLYEYNEYVLETWYEEYKTIYPEMIKSFERYLQNKEEDETLNNVKEEILLMLYNNRLVEQQLLK